MGGKCPWSPSVQAGCFGVRQDSRDIFTHTLTTHTHTHAPTPTPPEVNSPAIHSNHSYLPRLPGEDPAAKLPPCSFWTCRPTTSSSARGTKPWGRLVPHQSQCAHSNPTSRIYSFEAVKPPSIPDAPVRLAWPAKLHFYAFVSLRNHSGIKCWSEVRKKRLSQANEILAHYNLPNANGFCTGAGPKTEEEDASE